MIRRRWRRPARPRPEAGRRLTSVSLSGMQGEAEAMRLDRALAAVDLDVEARVAGMNLDGHHGVARVPRAAARCPRASPPGCRGRQACRPPAPGLRRPSSTRSSRAPWPRRARLRRRGRRARRRRGRPRPPGRRRDGSRRSRWRPSRRARPRHRSPVRAAIARSSSPAQTRSSASSIWSAVTALSAPRLPQAMPRTGASHTAAARSAARTVPSPPRATTRSPSCSVPGVASSRWWSPSTASCTTSTPCSVAHCVRVASARSTARVG